MKALKYFTMFLQVILICPFFASAADTISGTVTDSLSGKAIPLVTVKIASPSCSTYTDSQGRYSFTISTTRTIRELPQISWNAGGFSISGYAGYAGEVRYELVDPAGNKILSPDRVSLSAGVYFLRVQSVSQTRTFKIMNLNQSSPELKIVSPEFPPLARSAAASYILTYSKTDYYAATRTVSGTATS